MFGQLQLSPAPLPAEGAELIAESGSNIVRHPAIMPVGYQQRDGL